MATFGNRVEMLAALNFVESLFPSGQAPEPTYPWGVSNPAHSHPPQNSRLLSPPGVSADRYYSDLPDCPPPGLIRVLPATPAPLRVITNETASLFGDFARYLDDGIDEDGNPVLIDLTCCICLESKLRVSGCGAANGPCHGPVTFENLSVLPCGHFFGAECLYEWLLSGDGGASCPLCRFELAYSCGHSLEPREYNPLMFRREQIPQTVPEGGLVPRSCQHCYESCIDGTVERLRHLLFPPYVVPGDLQYSDSAEILRGTSSLFKGRILDFLVMSEHYIRW
ncbi:hypothetical protein F5B21DRAFT_522683 [Xylaria acuta]|nr:hypothetical protein F5B21DRAFT_522683 [Xylaria acuta]